VEIIENRTMYADDEEDIVGPELSQIVQVPTRYDAPVPVFNGVLIKANATDAVFAGTNFVIPDSAKQRPNRGVVVATSKRFIVNGVAFPMEEEVKVGDIVTFGVFNTETITVDGEAYELCQIFDLKLIERVSYAVNAA